VNNNLDRPSGGSRILKGKGGYLAADERSRTVVGLAGGGFGRRCPPPEWGFGFDPDKLLLFYMCVGAFLSDLSAVGLMTIIMTCKNSECWAPRTT